MKQFAFMIGLACVGGSGFAAEAEIPCYSVELSAWTPAMQLGGDEIYMTTPRAIALTNDVARESGSALEFAIKPALGADKSVHRLAYWHPEGDDIELVWSNGFSGITAHLSPTAGGFRGKAQTFWDFERPSQSSAIQLHKIACN